MQKSKLQVKSQKFALRDLGDTEKFARRVAKKLRGGDVLALSGPLGSGKTTFTQALGRALGIKRDVKSPTFVVMHLHRINAKLKMQKSKLQVKNKKLSTAKPLLLCHVDAYRIKNLDELAAIGLYDYLGSHNVITVIEWAEKIKKVLPKNKTTFIKFSFKKSERRVLLKRG